ncbi:MAG: NUDIX hydrolase [bacterium]
MISKTFNHIRSTVSVFKGDYLAVEKMTINLPDGSTGKREIVQVRDAAAVLAVDKNEKLYLIRQYRHAVQKYTLEVPAGLIDENETPEQTAIRECEEETGYRPHNLKKLLYYAHSEGYSTGYTTLFLGTELEHTGKTNPDSTEFLERVSMPFEDFFHLIETQKILDSKSILSGLLYKFSIEIGV